MIAAPPQPATECPLCRAGTMRPVAQLAAEAAIARCHRCGLARGEHRPAMADAADHFRGLDADRYLRSVGATRLRSYDKLLAEVQPLVSSGTWLDVGCSYGWLLERVGVAGYQPIGLEPSSAAAAEARTSGLNVIEGFFPADVPADIRPNVISFMDVLEHLPDPVAALRAAKDQLAPGGVVVVQVPDQACCLYQVAEALCRATGGRSSFALRRLWLVGFDFPHLYYFTRKTLAAAMATAGLKVEKTFRSPVGSPRESLDRVAYASAGPIQLKDRCVALAVAGIQVVDGLTGYGGLLTMIARGD
ncbi:class I SAM-dependent methyltransferase [Anatilimnocola floriformis]|uniref:class I SAM-dependent methyltransferase n=1 Tax=Anatilimnocola floriformis TaxID=2948575 RepID=UPI0020C45755|nr:class I SAM-dependent methyltransferase [Anatilimnocola floriformis]